jgi:hypothetical protein
MAKAQKVYSRSVLCTKRSLGDRLAAAGPGPQTFSSLNCSTTSVSWWA